MRRVGAKDFVSTNKSWDGSGPQPSVRRNTHLNHPPAPSQDTTGSFSLNGVLRVSGRFVSYKPVRVRPEPIDEAITAMLCARTHRPWRQVRAICETGAHLE